jgi:hypothetical protein
LWPILIDGELVASAGKTLRQPEERGIGMVFQDLVLWPLRFQEMLKIEAGSPDQGRVCEI